MICSDPSCGCGIVSDSLTITGSGAPGNPYRLETNAFSIVTSTTRPTTPFVGQFIWETDSQRQRVWTGAHWLIVGGAMPAWNLTRASTDTTSIPHNITTSVPLLNEVEDSDGFHTGTTAVVTIPAGYGGDYLVNGGLGWLYVAAAGWRQTIINVASNATTPLERPNIVASSAAADGVNNAVKRFRLEAGATLTFQGYQTTGAALDAKGAWFTGTMVRHLPTLT